MLTNHRDEDQISKAALEVIMKMNNLSLDDKHMADTEFVAARRDTGTVSFEEDEFWSDVDDEGEELVDVDVLAGILDGMHIDTMPNQMGVWEQDFSTTEAVHIAKSGMSRKR